ncbi:hypothetical protein EAE99_007303 [Botrytis elliptica]|nr:hypothetical protein EAE99_007303 [Botrytis elliptica]
MCTVASPHFSSRTRGSLQEEAGSLQGEVSGAAWGFNTGLRNVHRGFSPFLQAYKRISTGRSVREPRGVILISQVGDDLAGFGILFGFGTLISQVGDDLAGFGVQIGQVVVAVDVLCRDGERRNEMSGKCADFIEVLRRGQLVQTGQTWLIWE